MKLKGFLAIDIGASGGKAFVGKYDGRKLSLEEVKRFPNNPVSLNGNTHWNIMSLHENILDGIRAASNRGLEIQSIGIDTWGVDYGLLDESGFLLGNPMHYRDMFEDDSMEYALEKAGAEWLFERSPTQFQPFNTLFQLISMKRRKYRALDVAKTLLPVPSLLSYFLSGEKSTEFTFATTTQMFDPAINDWCKEIIELFDLPDITTPIVEAGTVIGSLLPSISRDLASDMKVILPATHDTGSAVAAIPFSEETMFISTGTWCLEGVLLDRPARSKDVLRFNLANEGCYGGKYRLLKNVTGLWLVQELLREWRRDDPMLDYSRLTEMAREAKPSQGLIDIESPLFKKPASMESAIIEESGRHGKVPRTRGEIVRTAIEGIAVRTKQTLSELEQVTGKKIRRIHMVGGGVRNTLLCQLIADYTGLQVIAGPVEGTATGNIIVQMLALGELRDTNESAELIERSFEMVEYR